MGHSLLIFSLYNELIKTKQYRTGTPKYDIQIIFFIKQSPVVTLPLYRASPLPFFRSFGIFEQFVEELFDRNIIQSTGRLYGGFCFSPGLSAESVL